MLRHRVALAARLVALSGLLSLAGCVSGWDLLKYPSARYSDCARDDITVTSMTRVGTRVRAWTFACKQDRVWACTIHATGRATCAPVEPAQL